MKKTIAGAVAAPFVMLAMPVFAQDMPPAATASTAAAAGAAQPVKPPPLFGADLFKVYVDLVKEVRQISNHRTPLKERVERARNFTFSPETKAELMTEFGNDNPFHLAVEDLPEGGAAIHGKSDLLDHTDATSGATLHIDPITVESVVNRSYSGTKFDIAAPDLKVTSPGDLKLVDISDMHFYGDTKVGPFNFMIGKSSGTVGRMRFSAGESFTLDLNDMAIDVEASARKKMFDEHVVYRIASIDWGSDKVENVVTDLALVNIDGQAMENLTDFIESIDIAKQNDVEQTDAVKEVFKRFALDLSRHNGAIEIRDLSAQYHGQRAGLSGRVTLPNLQQGDLDSMQKTYEKLVLRLRVHVPMALVDDAAHRFSRSMMEAQAKQSGAPVTDMAVDLVARGLIGKMTDTLVKQQKWAHLEKNELVTVLEIRRGKTYLDGHLVNAKSNPFMAMAQGK